MWNLQDIYVFLLHFILFSLFTYLKFNLNYNLNFKFKPKTRRYEGGFSTFLLSNYHIISGSNLVMYFLDNFILLKLYMQTSKQIQYKDMSKSNKLPKFS